MHTADLSSLIATTVFFNYWLLQLNCVLVLCLQRVTSCETVFDPMMKLKEKEDMRVTFSFLKLAMSNGYGNKMKSNFPQEKSPITKVNEN